MKQLILIFFLSIFFIACKKKNNTSTNPTGTNNTVTDVDGNVYNTVTIGTQVWMKENLKTTHYRNGDAIATGLSNTDWTVTTSGAYAIYDNDAINNTTYGKLYNWYAVVDSRNIAPIGWHIPSETEWSILRNFLGGQEVAGAALKDTTAWKSPNTGATNSSGFTGLPGGIRLYTDGSFTEVGLTGDFWSSTLSDTNAAWGQNLAFSTIYFGQPSSNKNYGYSVRCIKD